ncbi:MAG: multicopper oxidase domain-containing protein [Bacteroidota bacterium]
MIFIVSALVFLCSHSIGSAQTYAPLPIPAALKGPECTLKIADTFAQLRSGNQTITGGINEHSFWGPTIFVNKGDTVKMTVINNLNDSTTLHWHGLHLPAVMDGGPHQVIPPGTIWKPYWKVKNNAATYWYHPHLHEMTLEHVSKGIGGFLIVNDEQESALPLPRTYGIDDIPLVFTSRRYDANNQFTVQNTAYGDYLLANGVHNAQYTFPKQIVRLRILNAEIERSYNIGFSDDRTFYVIGTDGGLKEKPLPVKRLHIAVGERYEILVDCTKDVLGTSIDLMAYNANQPFGFPGGEPAPNGPFGSLLNNKNFTMLHINIGESKTNPIISIPETLIPFSQIDAASATGSQDIRVMGGVPNTPTPFHFSGGIFNISRVDKSIPMNSTQTWTVTNSNVFGHTFHIHDVQFNIIARNGNASSVGDHEKGWKDVLYLPRNESATFIARFDDYADPLHPFMYHCHFSNHEDGGMMQQFVVVSPSTIQEEVADFSAVQVYPNPANDIIIIDSKNNELYYVSIHNVNGKTVMMLPQPEKDIPINISSLAKGFYTMRLTDMKTKQVIVRSFVK